MPRPIPKFSDHKHLLSGCNYTEPEEFKLNTLIKFECVIKSNHEYVLSIGDIKRKNKNPSICPHCARDDRENKQRVSYDFLAEYAEQRGLFVKNKKHYYKKENDCVVFSCKECKEHEIKISSLRHFIKTCNDHEKKACPICVKNELGLLNDKQFEDKILNIVYKYKSKPLKSKCDYDLLPDALRNNIDNNPNWILLEYVNTNELAKYQCVKCGEEKDIIPHNLFVGGNMGCNGCRSVDEKQRIYSEMIDFCRKSNVYPVKDEFYISVKDLIKFKCNKCGKFFEKRWKDKYYDFNCSNCFKSSKHNSEGKFASEIETIYGNDVIRNDRAQIKPYELDVYVPQNKIAFEYCGIMWHSTKYKENKYDHRNKHMMCEEKDIRLVTVFEDEWNERRDVCLSRIKHMFGKTSKTYYARKCAIKEISNVEALRFCDENHLQGRGHAKESYGLFMNDGLVSVMTFSKPSIVKRGTGYDWELNRFCSLVDINIVGGANRLLKMFSDKHKGEKLITFCDLRWGTGKVYENLGFSFVEKTRPNYFYVGAITKWKRKHRFSFTKQKLMKMFNETDSSLTEEKIARKNGLYQIHDCGHLKFEKVL